MPAGSRDFNALSRPLPDAILTRGWRKTATTAVRVVHVAAHFLPQERAIEWHRCRRWLV